MRRCLEEAQGRKVRLLSPDEDPVIVTRDIVTVPSFEIQARQEKSQVVYKGVSLVKETEEQDSEADSEDNVPIATVLTKKKESSLTREQIEDCKFGPKDERALGVTVAKLFDGVEYRGTIDSWRSARKRSYYHVTYTDGDEEELSQTELRDGYLLGLSDKIEAEWKL